MKSKKIEFEIPKYLEDAINAAKPKGPDAEVQEINIQITGRIVKNGLIVDSANINGNDDRPTGHDWMVITDFEEDEKE